MKYIINLTFFAGSNDLEDTDRKVYVIESEKELSRDDIVFAIREANRRCNCGIYEESEEDTEGFPSYEQGINIDTLAQGIGIILKDYAKIYPLTDVATVFDIEQWQ